MHGWKKRPLVFLIVASLVLFASTFPAAAAGEHPGEEITTESIMADFMLLRPLGVAASVVGTGFSWCHFRSAYSVETPKWSSKKRWQSLSDLRFSGLLER